MMRLLLLVFAISCAVARIIEFTDCGNGEVKWIDVEPCEKDPCEFRTGEKVKVTAEAVANHGSKKVKVNVKINAGLADIPIPGIDKDGCKLVDCPLVEGKKYELTLEKEVPAIPGVTVVPGGKQAKVKVEVQGDDKQLGCAETNVILKPKSLIPSFGFK